jgi:hypothetical protein
MTSRNQVWPHQTVPQQLPIRLRPRHRERTGSYLTRLADANRCPPWSFLRLLGKVLVGERSQLTPMAWVTLNDPALARLARYVGKPTHDLTRALPSILIADTWDEPAVRIRSLGRTFLRSCPQCEQRTGGTPMMPSQNPLDLACAHHQRWLVSDEDIVLNQAPEIMAAVSRLRRTRRRRGDDVTRVHYQLVYEYLTNDWRGIRWHRALTQRWTDRQQRMFPAAEPRDQFIRSLTHHWSMLPEAVTIVGLLSRTANPPLDARGISETLALDQHWSTAS